MGYTKGLCSCGFPQSYPLPHEHDRTERERQIIKHYEDTTKDLYEALEVALCDLEALKLLGHKLYCYENTRTKGRKALAKAEGK